MKKGKKSVNYAPVFRPTNIEVLGITPDRTLERLEIAHPDDCGSRNPISTDTFTRIYVKLRK